MHRDLHRFRLAPLLLWAAMLACLVVSPAAAGELGPRGAWVMADFNGDRQTDLAMVGGPGLGQELDVQLNAPQVPILTVLRFATGNRLNVRDLDGDSDRDIVLETPFRELIAVWLNDGAGHFHSGDVDNFRSQFPHDDRRTFDSPEQSWPLSEIAECPSRDAVSLRYPSFTLKSPGLILIPGHEENARSIHSPITRTRGPPSHS